MMGGSVDQRWEAQPEADEDEDTRYAGEVLEACPACGEDAVRVSERTAPTFGPLVDPEADESCCHAGDAYYVHHS
jgi:hypothetical protein